MDEPLKDEHSSPNPSNDNATMNDVVNHHNGNSNESSNSSTTTTTTSAQSTQSENSNTPSSSSIATQANLEKRRKGLNTLVEKAKMFSQFLGKQLVETEVNLKIASNGESSTQSKGKGKSKDEEEDSKSNGKKSKGKRKQPDTKSFSQKLKDAKSKELTEVEESHLKNQQPKLVTGGVLRDYQLAGVEWLIKHWMNGMNGILADEMGLGKTIQVISFLAHLWDNRVNGPSLIIAPLSVIQNWINEFTKWTPTIPVLLYHGDKDGRVALRDKMLQLSKKLSPFVVVTSYQIAMNDTSHLKRFKWKYLIVDEAHRLKKFNCRLILALQSLHTENRLLITGTPLQNNVIELWSLLHFVLPEVFDDVKSFQDWFSFDHLLDEDGAAKDDQVSKMYLTGNDSMEKFVRKLHEILQPFFLRRLKEHVGIGIPPKIHLALYAPFSKPQRALYEGILTSELKRKKINGKFLNLNSRFMQLRKAANHMLLFPQDLATLYLKDVDAAKDYIKNLANEGDDDKIELGKLRPRTSKPNYIDEYDEYEFDRIIDEYETKNSDDEDKNETKKKRKTQSETSEKSKGDGKDTYKLMSGFQLFLKESGSDITTLGPKWRSLPQAEKDEYNRRHKQNKLALSDHELFELDMLLAASGKLQLLDKMLPVLHTNGHKILLFSQFTKILGLLEDYLEHTGHQYCYLDGATNLQDRQEQIETFSKDPDVFIFLISTRAGGLGLNLVAADTVIFFDSDWNPQSDKQAMDRCHRIGQTRPVVVYRLITANSIEIAIQRCAKKKMRLESLIIEKAGLSDTLNGVNEDYTFNNDDLKQILQMELEDVKLGHEIDGAITDEQLALVLDREKCFEMSASAKRGKENEGFLFVGST